MSVGKCLDDFAPRPENMYINHLYSKYSLEDFSDAGSSLFGDKFQSSLTSKVEKGGAVKGSGYHQNKAKMSKENASNSYKKDREGWFTC